MRSAPGLSVIVIIALTGVAQGGVRDYLSKPDAWFGGEQAAEVADRVLSWQSDLGGWPKNVDTTSPYRGADREHDLKPTFDNGATTDELRYLARMFNATGETKHQDAFSRGLDHILRAQYPTGGWPQCYPPGRAYPRHITFNDNAMTRLMVFLREIGSSPRYAFVDRERRSAASKAFDRGIECILRCQIRVDGKPTAWCAQHDEVDFSPRPARAFELVSLSGSESVGVVRLLMSLEHPDPAVIGAIESAVAWLQLVKLTGLRVEQKPAASLPKGFDVVVTPDATAPPIWARFYEIGANRPFFCDRDGVAKYRLSEISPERRTGYRWYGPWAEKLLTTEYPAWRQKHGLPVLTVGASDQRQDAAAEAAEKTRIVLVGDSTVTDNAGWGAAFARRLAPDVECVNLARGGQSSRSYRAGGWWKKALEQKPDYVLIQFGHNDQPGKGPERETDPATTYREFLRQYVDEARAAGAEPILVTSVVRRNFGPDGKLVSSLAPYADAVRAVAAEKRAPAVDLHEASLELLNRIGPAAAAPFSPPHPTEPNKLDTAHLSAAGADAMAKLVIAELLKAEPSAKSWFTADAAPQEPAGATQQTP